MTTSSVSRTGGTDEALLVEVGGAGGHARGLGAADVRIVRPGDRVAELGARDERDVGQMRPTGERVVDDKDVSRLGVVRPNGGDRFGHRAEVDGDVLRLRDHPAVRREERRRAIAPLLDVRGEGRADQHGAHLLRHRPERAAHDLELDIHCFVTALSGRVCYSHP